MERMIKKYGRSELKRIGTQEPKNGTEQPKQNEKKSDFTVKTNKKIVVSKAFINKI